MADFSLEGVTKKRLSRYHREQRELGLADDRVPAQAGADCRDVRGEGALNGRGILTGGRRGGFLVLGEL
ncbi:MAG: hypothetical protein C5S49_02825 [Candidatus Methanogaster sp.]|nr:MAG: hypothetical protein C5S49_02825 [ANME-2 cluster archaeon]